VITGVSSLIISSSFTNLKLKKISGNLSKNNGRANTLKILLKRTLLKQDEWVRKDLIGLNFRA